MLVLTVVCILSSCKHIFAAWSHILDNNIVDSFQSAYRAGHSCETALLRVYNDIVTTVGKGNGSFLVLLDLSAAFDTIDHDNVFYILEKYVGIGGSALRLILFWIFVNSKLHILFGNFVDENGASFPWTTNQEQLFSFINDRGSDSVDSYNYPSRYTVYTHILGYGCILYVSCDLTVFNCDVKWITPTSLSYSGFVL